MMTEVDLTRKVSVKQLNKGKAAATKVGSASSRRRVDTLSPKVSTIQNSVSEIHCKCCPSV